MINPNDPHVPIISPFDFMLWYPTAILKCKCLEAGTILVIVNIGTAATCPHCRKVYKAIGLNAEGGLLIDCQLPTIGGSN